MVFVNVALSHVWGGRLWSMPGFSRMGVIE